MLLWWAETSFETKVTELSLTVGFVVYLQERGMITLSYFLSQQNQWGGKGSMLEWKVNFKVPRRVMWPYCFSHLGNFSAKLLCLKRRKLKLFKEKGGVCEMICTLIQFSEKRWSHTSYFVLNILLIKWKNKYKNFSRTHKKWPNHFWIYVFQSTWPSSVTVTMRILKRSPRSQWSVSLAKRYSSQELGTFSMFCFCFCSGCSKFTMIWKHLFSCVMA